MKLIQDYDLQQMPEEERVLVVALCDLLLDFHALPLPKTYRNAMAVICDATGVRGVGGDDDKLLLRTEIKILRDQIIRSAPNLFEHLEGTVLFNKI